MSQENPQKNREKLSQLSTEDLVETGRTHTFLYIEFERELRTKASYLTDGLYPVQKTLL